MHEFKIAPPRELEHALPRELAAWISGLPAKEKAVAFRMLPIHRAAVAFIECRNPVRGELLEHLDAYSLRRLCRLVSSEVLRDPLEHCSVGAAQRVEAALMPVPADRHASGGRGALPAAQRAVDGVWPAWSLGRVLRDAWLGTR